MGYNDYIRNEWQQIIVKPASNVTLTDVNCTALTRNENVLFALTAVMTVQDDAANVKFDIEIVPSLEPVRVSCITPHTDISGGDTRFSLVMVDFAETTLTITGFPLTHSRIYDIKVQFFYRVI